MNRVASILLADQFKMNRVASILLAALTLAACGSDDAVSVSGAWSRASAPTQTSGVAYFELTVVADDTLVGVSVPASVASGAEIHEVVTDGVTIDDMPLDHLEDGSADTMEMSDMSMDEMDASEGSHDMDMSTDEAPGLMRMQGLPDGLALTGGETVSFAPGSYHVMLPRLVAPLEAGAEFDLTLDFANADDVTVTVEVVETAP